MLPCNDMASIRPGRILLQPEGNRQKKLLIAGKAAVIKRDIKGSIIYSNPGKDEKYEAGIEFVDTDDATTDILKKYIKVFSEQ